MWRTLGSSMLYYTSNGSDKFYEVEVQTVSNPGSAHGMALPPFRVRARYGRRGADSSWSIKNHFGHFSRALDEAVSILMSKYRKGYTAHLNGVTQVNNVAQFRIDCSNAYNGEATARPGVRGLTGTTRIVDPSENLSNAERAAAMSLLRAQEEERSREREQQRLERERRQREHVLERAIQNPEYEDFTPRVIDFEGVD